jgi:hypothetical protein
MKIYLVCSTSKSWMNTGYGHSLLAGEMPKLLVSFVEFSKDPSQQVAVRTMSPTYAMPASTPDTPKKPGIDAKQVARIDHGTAFRILFEGHMEELFDEGKS